MSTFGKKSLAWWNYHDHSRDNVRRYILSDKDMQLEILKKWYPIGFKVQEHAFSRVLTVVGYIENMAYWNLKLESDDNFLFNQTHIKHPLSVTPVRASELELKRQIKLEKILK